MKAGDGVTGITKGATASMRPSMPPMRPPKRGDERDKRVGSEGAAHDLGLHKVLQQEASGESRHEHDDSVREENHRAHVGTLRRRRHIPAKHEQQHGSAA